MYNKTNTMNKEFYKMQKIAGVITEGQYKEKLNEAKDDLVTLLYSLRNSINDEDKIEALSKLEDVFYIVRDMEDANKEKNKDFYNDVMKLSEMQGEEYDTDTVKGSNYADDPGYNDKVAFLADAFQYVWGMGKGNNTINFDGMAKSTIEDLETRF